MATLKLSLIDEKIAEITTSMNVLKGRNNTDPTDPTYISKNTLSTQVYHRTRDRKVLHLIRSLIAANPEVKLEPEDMNTFVLITTLASERVTTKYQFEVGDSLLDIMAKYEDLSRKNLDAKLEKLGLKMDYADTKKVIKA